MDCQHRLSTDRDDSSRARGLPFPDQETAPINSFGKAASPSIRLILLLVNVVLLLCLAPAVLGADRACFVVTGLGGTAEYQENFAKWGDAIAEICGTESGSTLRADGSSQRKDEILRLLAGSGRAAGGARELWVFLIGHGSFDGRDYKFNISGPDLTATDLRDSLEDLGLPRVIVVAATSCSGALLEPLGGEGRVLVTATKSPQERHPPLFISFLIEAAGSAEADLDKDGRVSLKEAFAFVEERVTSWYQERGRIQTEHPVLRDSSQGQLLAAAAYLSAPPEKAYRSLEAKELAKDRIRLEREIEDLKLRKPDMVEADYFTELERLLLELATLNEKIELLEGSP